MELDDGLDDLLAEINEPSSPKKPRNEQVNSHQLGRLNVKPYLYRCAKKNCVL